MSVAVATSADTPSAPTAREDNARGRGGHRGRGRGRPPRGTDASAVEQRPNSARRGGRRPQGDRGPKPPSEAAVANSNPSATMAASLEPQHPPPTHSDASTRGQPASQPGRGRGGPSRRSNFRGKLTDDAPPEPTPSVSLPQRDAPPHQRQRAPASLSSDADLLTRLTHGLSNPPYLDCLICFNAITPPQPVWSCSPSSDDPSSTSVHCWTTLHLKCAVAWARKNIKETREAFQSRNEDKSGEWRCPGCNKKRILQPQTYVCFCGRTDNPKPGRLGTPHSCGGECSRKRTACDHPCPLSCHPGPCPPCIVTVQSSCHCSRVKMSFRCTNLTGSSAESLSCGKSCDKLLPCGIHRCAETCHPGACAPCSVTKTVKCYCGRSEHTVTCGEEGELRTCKTETDGSWEGYFECDEVCSRPFACGKHKCKKSCHVPSRSPPMCPFDPVSVTTCPCGKQPLSSVSIIPRSACTDPIPTCGAMCLKPLSSCSHACSSPCHTGPCPPCMVQVAVPCRCGETTTYFPCHQRQAQLRGGDDEVVLCDKVCRSQRDCGRHQCNRRCCPVAALAAAKARNKGKKKPILNSQNNARDEDDELIAYWHQCDLTCEKMLSCGLHRCQIPDHRGPCPPCLQSSFEERICPCGRTILYPPIPCGVQLVCSYPCALPPPPCGHPKVDHPCHAERGEACPQCHFLTSKLCACGKSMVGNVRCSQERVSCGTVCGKLLSCGFHHCEKLCHGDDCGSCNATCGKPRKLCLPAQHACTLPCHAPSLCDESEGCKATITLKCPCGRLQQLAPCGRSTTNPTGRDGQQLKCGQECLVAKRNARLAEALGISPAQAKEKQGVVYSDELKAFCRANGKFHALVEKTLNEFVTSEKKAQVLPHMPEVRRKYVRDLANIYRIDTQILDGSVQVLRRIDSRIPEPSLSSLVNVSQPGQSAYGKLAAVDLRSGMSPSITPHPPTTSRTQPTPTPPPRPAWGVVQPLRRAAPPTSAHVSADVPQNWDDE